MKFLCIYEISIIFCLVRSFERTTTPIWFNKLINNEAEIAGDFLESRKRIFTNASTNSIVDIISMIQIATLQTTFHFSKLISMVYLQDLQRSTLFTDFSQEVS